jgi:uncharacterized membrane protein YgdD (TMEM256/DUF423 family)
MTKVLVLLGAINGFLAVAIGAFGAHALRDHFAVGMLEVYKTGVQYHMVHALALLLIGVLGELRRDTKLLEVAGWFFVVGIPLFCGSLYGLAITDVRIFGAITPLGGLCFLTGWVLVAAASLKS